MLRRGMSHSVDKVRWITVWILAEEPAANSLIRNLGSEGRESESELSAPENSVCVCVCGWVHKSDSVCVV